MSRSFKHAVGFCDRNPYSKKLASKARLDERTKIGGFRTTRVSNEPSLTPPMLLIVPPTKSAFGRRVSFVVIQSGVIIK